MRRWAGWACVALLLGCGGPPTEPRETETPPEQLRGAGPRERKGFEIVSSAAISRDGKLALTVYTPFKGRVDEPRSLALWDLGGGKNLWTLKHQQLPVSLADFFPDGKQLLVKSGDRILALGLDGKVVREIFKDAESVRRFAFTPDGKSLLLAATDGSVKILAMPACQVVGSFKCGQGNPSVRGLIISSDSKLAMCWDGNLRLGDDVMVWLWDIPNRRLLREFKDADGWFPPAAFSPDGKQAVIGRTNPNEERAPHRLQLLGVADGKRVRELAVHASTAVFSPSPAGDRLLYAGWLDREVGIPLLALVDLQTGKEIYRIPFRLGVPFVAMAFSADGGLVFSAEGAVAYGRDSIELKLWDATTGVLIRSF